MNNKRHVISLLMENKAGALSRVVGLFSARGFNIENLNVAPTQDETVSRLTLVTYCDEKLIEQINKQLNKLIKINVDAKQRGHYLQLAEAFRARVIAITPTTVIFEVTGSQRKLDAFIDILESDIIVEMARTGMTGLAATGSGKCLEL